MDKHPPSGRSVRTTGGPLSQPDGLTARGPIRGTSCIARTAHAVLKKGWRIAEKSDSPREVSDNVLGATPVQKERRDITRTGSLRSVADCCEYHYRSE